MSRWRHLRAIGLLPVAGAGVVPATVLAASGWGNIGWGLGGVAGALTVVLGVILVLTGLVLMWRTILLLARLGEGTLAPWDPTKKLVVAGPYRFVRNPMIVGVARVLLGEASVFGSVPLLGWAACSEPSTPSGSRSSRSRRSSGDSETTIGNSCETCPAGYPGGARGPAGRGTQTASKSGRG